MRGHLSKAAGAAVLMAAVMTSGGCGSLVTFNAEHIDDGMVFVLPGIDGPGLGPLGVMAAVAENTDLAVRQFDWTIPFGLLFNQTAEWRNRDMGKLLASQIVEYTQQHPGAPVYLIGHSGGTAVAVWAAEALPADVRIEGIVLLASSLSPGYDLSKALARTNGGIVNVFSRSDSGLLGAGTTMIGTMDGVYGQSAGMAGFYQRGAWGYGGRLVQMEWTGGMSRVGYHGDHFSVCSPSFIAAYIAPMMADGSWQPISPISSADTEVVSVVSR